MARARTVVLCALALTVLGSAVPALAAAPPTAKTTAPDTTLLTDSYALLSGVVNPNGAATSYWFEWGETTEYGNVTPVTSAGDGKVDVPVDVSLDDLKPSTLYHYRIVAAPTGKQPGDPSEVKGGDAAFRTPSPLSLTIGGVFGRLRVNGGKVPLRLRCAGPATETCDGRLSLRARIQGTRIEIGALSYSVDSRTTKAVAVKINGLARKALAKGRLPATAQTKVGGTKQTVKRTFVLVG